MTRIKVGNITLNKGQVKGLPSNPRFIRDEKFESLKKSLQDDPEMMELRELIVFPHDGKFVVIGGNMRYRGAVELGYKTLPCKVLPADTHAEKLRAITIKDNTAYGEWDMNLLGDWDIAEMESWGMDVPITEPEPEGLRGELYTQKIQIPTYEPKNEKPPIELLVNTDKTDELIKRIKESKVPNKVKELLIMAARRHTVFNYSAIADYYSHSDDDVKSLFEDSALVIIDYGKAIAEGYVRLTERMAAQYSNDHGTETEE